MAHFAVVLTQDRKQQQAQGPKPTTVGQFQEAKPQPGVVTEEICAAALFPKLTNPWPLNKNWDITPDPIPPAITDSNQVSVITEQNRIGGQMIRHHNPTTGNNFLKNFFYRVGVTEFIHKLNRTTHVTPGVNLFGATKEIDAFGSTSVSIGAQQGTISETVGEENDFVTPANQFAVRTGFLLPTKEIDGLLILAARRTLFHTCRCAIAYGTRSASRSPISRFRSRPVTRILCRLSCPWRTTLCSTESGQAKCRN